MSMSAKVMHKNRLRINQIVSSLKLVLLEQDGGEQLAAIGYVQKALSIVEADLKGELLTPKPAATTPAPTPAKG